MSMCRHTGSFQGEHGPCRVIASRRVTSWSAAEASRYGAALPGRSRPPAVRRSGDRAIWSMKPAPSNRPNCSPSIDHTRSKRHEQSAVAYDTGRHRQGPRRTRRRQPLHHRLISRPTTSPSAPPGPGKSRREGRPLIACARRGVPNATQRRKLASAQPRQPSATPRHLGTREGAELVGRIEVVGGADDRFGALPLAVDYDTPAFEPGECFLEDPLKCALLEWVHFVEADGVGGVDGT